MVEQKKLNGAKSKDTLVSIPAQIYNMFTVDYVRRRLGHFLGLKIFNINEGIEYIVEDDVILFGYRAEEDITMILEVTRFTGKVELITNATAGIYNLDGIPMYNKDTLVLTKGNKVDLYYVYDVSNR